MKKWIPTNEMMQMGDAKHCECDRNHGGKPDVYAFARDSSATADALNYFLVWDVGHVSVSDDLSELEYYPKDNALISWNWSWLPQSQGYSCQPA